MTEGYKLIVRFFKEIGLYNEFIAYNNSDKWYVSMFRPYEEDPLKNFGNTSITHWLKDNKGITVKSGNFFDYFKAWLYVFYPDYYIRDTKPQEEFLKAVDKEKKIIEIEYEHS